ncbi:unnamed protein product [Calicophoron daubneyi]|uniref:Uncharacterized protein n=1 Tax=Calicophoron daubneyi TaxID=300641 RepID=A0AAV2T2W9_CALDB
MSVRIQLEECPSPRSIRQCIRLWHEILRRHKSIENSSTNHTESLSDALSSRSELSIPYIRRRRAARFEDNVQLPSDERQWLQQAATLSDETVTIPTLEMPAIYILPVRAVLITSSNLIPAGQSEKNYNKDVFHRYRFHVMQVRYGVIQILTVNSKGEEWTVAEQFTGLQVLAEQVRYVGTVMQPDSQSGKFEDRVRLTCVRSEKSGNNQRLVLPIIFIRIRIKIRGRKELTIPGFAVQTSMHQRETIESVQQVRSIKPYHLYVEVEPPERDSFIYFTVVFAPQHGHLFLTDNPEDLQSAHGKDERIYLGVNSQFTQDDLSRGRLFYVLRRIVDEESVLSKSGRLTDGFDFKVHVPGAQLKTTEHFTITVTNILNAVSVSEKSPALRLVNRGGELREGGQFLMTPDVFYAEQPGCMSRSCATYFQFLTLPEHGTLWVRSERDNSMTRVQRYISYPVELIEKKCMMYRHDSSENFKDNFQFEFFTRNEAKKREPGGGMTSVSSRLLNSQGETVSGLFILSITPVNDNPPSLVARSLLVEMNATTRISGRWLVIQDKDFSSHFDDTRYFELTWEHLPNYERPDVIYPHPGYFVDSRVESRLNSFRAIDILQENVSFRNLGMPLERIKLTVTDGDFTSSQLVMINVSRDFFSVVQPNPIRVIAGQSVPLFFEILTNLELSPASVRIHLTRNPCKGTVRSDQSSGFDNWTYEDFVRYRVLYTANQTSLTESVLDRSKSSVNLDVRCEVLYEMQRMPDYLLGLEEDYLSFAVSAKYANVVWHERLSFHFRIDSLPPTGLNLLPRGSDMPDVGQSYGIDQRLFVEQGKDVVLHIAQAERGQKRVLPENIFYYLNKHPRYGILNYQTSCFKLHSINVFTLADVMANRISYHQLSTKLSEHSQTNRSAVVDCFDFSLTDILHRNGKAEQPFFYGKRTKNWSTKGQTFGYRELCVTILFPGLKLKSYDLILQEDSERSLIDANLTPWMQMDTPIRHDQPTNDKSFQSESEQSALEYSIDTIGSFGNLEVKTENTRARNIVYLIKKCPQFGKIVSKRLNSSVCIFSEADVQADDIYYVHHADFHKQTDVVELSAYDPVRHESTAVPVSIRLTIQHRTLQLTDLQPTSIAVGSVAQITASNLHARTRSSSQADVIRFEHITTHSGHLAKESRPAVALTSFTQKDIDDGRIIFVHSGDELDQPCGFEFILTSPEGRSGRMRYSLLVYQVKLKVIRNRTVAAFPLGAEPITSWHLLSQLSVSPRTNKSRTETNSVVKTRENRLQTECCMLSPAKQQHGSPNQQSDRSIGLGFQITYSVLTSPVHGNLIRLSDSPGDLRWSKSNVQKFTQEDIEEGRIFYVYTALADRVRSLMGNFQAVEESILLNVTITKRINTGGPEFVIPKQTAIIPLKVSVAYEHITLQNYRRLITVVPLVVGAGKMEEITSKHVNANPLNKLIRKSMADGYEVPDFRHINFNLVRQPQHGKLTTDRKQLSVGSVLPGLSAGRKHSRLFYTHDGSQTIEDAILTRLSFENTTLMMTDLILSIPVKIVQTTGIHPILTRPATTQSTDYRFVKNHTVQGGLSAEKWDHSLTHPIYELPVGTAIRLDADKILFTDPDTPPRNIHIWIISYPQFGQLCLCDDLLQKPASGELESRARCFRASNFTQEDVNNGRLIFRTQYAKLTSVIFESFTFGGADDTTAKTTHKNSVGTLMFRIWPSFFSIQVLPVSILQGDQMVSLSRDNIEANITTGRGDGSGYNFSLDCTFLFSVLDPPKHGNLVLDTVPVNRFTQYDLNSGRVRYQQFDLSAPNDSAVLRVACSLADTSSPEFYLTHSDTDPFYGFEGNEELHTDFIVPIRVRPRLKLRAINILPGSTTFLDSQVVDSVNLRQLLKARSIAEGGDRVRPYFTLRSPSRLQLGRIFVNDELLVSTAYPNEKLSSEVNVSLDAIETNRVRFEAYTDSASSSAKHDTSGSIQEELPFTFWAGNDMQPAQGAFILRRIRDSGDVNAADDYPQRAVGLSLHNSAMASDFTGAEQVEKTLSVTVIGFAVGLSVLTLIAVTITVLCFYRRRNRRTDALKPLNFSPSKTAKEKLASVQRTQDYRSAEILLGQRFASEQQYSCTSSVPQNLTDEQCPMVSFELAEKTSVLLSDANIRSSTSKSASCGTTTPVIYLATTLPNALHFISSSNVTPQICTSMHPSFVVLPQLGPPTSSLHPLSEISTFEGLPQLKKPDCDQCTYVKISAIPEVSKLESDDRKGVTNGGGGGGEVVDMSKNTTTVFAQITSDSLTSCPPEGVSFDSFAKFSSDASSPSLTSTTSLSPKAKQLSQLKLRSRTQTPSSVWIPHQV